MSTSNLYLDGEYLAKNPQWHAEESPFKAKQVLRMLRENHLTPTSICDVGCGAGEVLIQLQKNLGCDCIFRGYDISPQAFALAQCRTNGKLHFKLGDVLSERDAFFDLVLALDVIEHLEDYWSFLRQLRTKGRYKIFHIPLDLSVQTVFRPNALLKRRSLYAHLHYFTKETALRTLQDAGYEVLRFFYTPRSIEVGPGFGERLLNLPRRLCFAFSPDSAARWMGGFSLLVLAR